MSSDSDKPDSQDQESQETAIDSVESKDVVVREGGAIEAEGSDVTPDEELIAAEVGVERYVHAAFFGAGILTAYLGGKMLLALWNELAEWPDVVRSVPLLLEYGEEERASITLIIGAVVGVLLVLRYYRRPAVRSWATSVASELARVTWPSKDTVTNGTVVVLVAGAVATVYIALLDRLWGYLTNLVYGA